MIFLTHLKQLDIEDQPRVGRDRPASAARAIAQLRWDIQPPLPADLHARDTHIPTIDHLPAAEVEDERLAAIEKRIGSHPDKPGGGRLLAGQSRTDVKEL